MAFSSRRLVTLVASLTVLVAACSETATPDPDAYRPAATAHAGSPLVFPAEQWERIDPRDGGFDPAALDALAAKAEEAGSACLVVTRDGRLVVDRYWRGTGPTSAREAFSVTKSVTSLLVGIAQDDGDLTLDDPAARFIPAWRGNPAEAVTIRNLLSNDSGRHWDLATDYLQMAVQAPDKTAFAVGLPQDHPPGEVWAYNNSAIQTLSAVLEAATGEDPVELAERRLFAPIGMKHSRLSRDPAGNALAFMGLQTTCEDLARFGLLVLRKGEWDGRRIISEDYLELATGAPSTPLNAAYGFLFWLNHRGRIASPLIAVTGRDEAPPTGGQTAGQTDSQLVPGAPESVVWALGYQQQIVAIVPSEGIVAVRLGEAPPPGVSFDQGTLTTGVLDALIDRRGGA